jgi:NAD(P)-dependent dehydrogenase (short-subunit alcohol dehydrogenase family)
MDLDNPPAPLGAAIVTGAAAGIGAATATALAEAGYQVTAVDRRFLETVPGAGVRCVELDVRDHAACRQLIVDIGADLSLLVNVAAVRPEAPVLDQDVEGWRTAMDVNVIGPFVLLQAAARTMRPGGSIVNVASGAAYGKPLLVAYGASKAALISMSRTAAMELAAAGVRVNVAVPGTTETPMLTSASTYDPEHRARSRNTTGEVLSAEQVAAGIVRVAQDPLLSGAVVPLGLLPVAW